jgi:hypothetical protein
VDGNHSGKIKSAASDVTDGEWALIEPQLPAKRPLGRPREVELRAVFNALLYRSSGEAPTSRVLRCLPFAGLSNAHWRGSIETAKDFEASLAGAKAWLYLGSIQLLILAACASIIQLIRF